MGEGKAGGGREAPAARPSIPLSLPSSRAERSEAEGSAGKRTALDKKNEVLFCGKCPPY
jgi:hypothetical protein